CLQGYTSPYSF
nr:immunoglobulin light chain junction region [Macaca mulatta]